MKRRIIQVGAHNDVVAIIHTIPAVSGPFDLSTMGGKLVGSRLVALKMDTWYQEPHRTDLSNFWLAGIRWGSQRMTSLDRQGTFFRFEIAMVPTIPMPPGGEAHFYVENKEDYDINVVLFLRLSFARRLDGRNEMNK